MGSSIARNAGLLIDRVSQVGLIISAGLVGLLMVTQVTEVILRSMGRPTTWVFDLNLTALLGAIFLGLAGAERRGENVAVDFLTSRVKGNTALALFTFNAAVSIGFLILLAWSGALVAAQSASQGRSTGGLFSLPAAVPESLLPIGATMLALQITAGLVRALVSGQAPPTRDDTAELLLLEDAAADPQAEIHP